MSQFMYDNFMLDNEMAKKIYNDFAKSMPIYDFHCHLDPEDIAKDRVYKNMTEIWLNHDHYKWRLMRWYGVKEHFITGDASDYEKFEKWAEVISYGIGNPVYLWSHMELKQFFNITEPLNKRSAKKIWHEINEQLPNLSVKKMIEQSNVKVICTTDDPTDDLVHHLMIREDEHFETSVTPTFRPDKIVNIKEDETYEWLKVLEKQTLVIGNLDDLMKALELRMKYFNDLGCKISDHSIENPTFIYPSGEEATAIFDKLLTKKMLSEMETIKLSSYMLVQLGMKYKKFDWTMQLHIGALRNNNSKMLKSVGKDSGFDALADNNFITSLSSYLDILVMKDALPRTVLYCLNPKDYASLSVLSGCFQNEGTGGYVQLGAAWWFNDHKKGINDQLETLASTGMLSQSVGMLTDSRSFLSFTRHDYYRRLLCNMIGKWVELGEIPYDEEHIKHIVENICFNNADKYFNISIKGGTDEYKR